MPRDRPPSSSRPRQLVLDLAGAPNYAAEDFLVSPSNADAFRFMELWPDWPSRRVVLLGEAGSGKSHLAAIWAKRAGAVEVAPTDVAALPARPCVLLEDADTGLWPEAAFFHLLNAVAERGGDIVMTAREPPDRWGIATPDLLSRLRLFPCITIGRPDTGLVRAVLVKLFTERQIAIDTEVVAFAALHLDRSLAAAGRFVREVDEAALSAGRRITRPLAAATIAAMAEVDDYGPT